MTRVQEVGERVGGRVEVDVGQGESAHQAPHVREISGPHHVREERRRAAEKVDGHRSEQCRHWLWIERGRNVGL